MLFFISEENDYNFNMKRKGQAFIIVVIIFGLIVSVFAISISTAMRSQALEETEIYQREQALYLAQMGINQMIYNINNGADYTTPLNNSITITAPGVPDAEGKAIYYKDDDIKTKYGGAGYIEGIGTVNKSQSQPITRRIFISLTSEAFKYCLYTSTGGRDAVNNDSYFNNPIYGNSYLYNTIAGMIPTPDTSFYLTDSNYDGVINAGNNDYTYIVPEADLEKLVLVKFTKANKTLTINFNNITSSNFQITIATNAKDVTIENIRPPDRTWSGAIRDGITYPLLIHMGTGTVDMQLTEKYLWYEYDLTFQGFIYTGGSISITYWRILLGLLG